MPKPIVAVVTGANRGIGEAIAQQLAKTFTEPLCLYATSRKGQNLDLQTAPNTRVSYAKLDISDPQSIKDLANAIKRDNGSVDVLINNAGVNLDNMSNPDDVNPKNVKTTLDTNVRGTLKMCQSFMPLLSEGGRIVNVSSTASSLGNYSKAIQQRFRNPKMTLEDLEGMMQEYQTCADTGTERQNGWPQLAYGVSKACVNALTAILARENPGLTINACCPGWVATDMGSLVGTPTKTPEEGSRIPIRLGFKDIGGITGRYWGNPSVSDTREGQVMEW